MTKNYAMSAIIYRKHQIYSAITYIMVCKNYAISML